MYIMYIVWTHNTLLLLCPPFHLSFVRVAEDATLLATCRRASSKAAVSGGG